MTVHLGTSAQDRWLRRYQSAVPGTPRLVCFPHAGGSATQYVPLSEALAPAVDTLAVQYPGHQDRYGEPCVEDLARLADDICAVLLRGPGSPLALFGHSMGAVLAWEVASRLERTAGPGSVTHLFVSGRRAPSCARAENVHRLDDAALITRIRRLGGTPPALVANQQMLRLILPVLRSDYTAVETHRPDPALRLTCPLVALTGDRDPMVTLEEARRWTTHTTGPAELRVFSGGHFFPEDHLPEIAALISACLLPAPHGVRNVPPVSAP
ncbi:thioesterase II family protein [Streptomyces sp. DSM 15324]|uniref:thioesterase II family protein n=1 Tax=Streptomyces sp. DSM 15324 TaxID=1739111 RepID=UPI00074ADEB1|nr:alpha/beta fold hydrolase [Streptomyces sp. DSM 15324]KUO12338.1 hypothetical protein AQJ58_08895 [Streptomyces sp. DSM 15324]